MQNLASPAGILVAEDDPEVWNYLSLSLRCRGYTVTHAENGEEVLSHLRSSGANGVSLVLMDVMMPRKDGLETLRGIRQFEKNLPVIMLSGLSSPTTIVEAMKCGANDFLAKPVGNEQLMDAIQRTLNARTAKPDGMKYEAVKHPEGPMASRGLVDRHSWMSKMEPFLSHVGASDAPVLLNGETGSGKEVLARRLHAASPRASRPLLKLNCAALPSELIESELFGYEKGAFTGAFKSKPGKFALANGGTVLLDEIGDMDIRLQAKLLHVLQDGEFEPLGGNETVRVNVRVMAATHNDLEKAIRDGRFREDLYYRLNVINIQVPPLRERLSEIPTLAEYFLKKFATPGGPPPKITAALHEALLAYAWPGNVRELENFMRRFLILPDAEAAADELRKKTLRAGNAAAAVALPEPSSTVPQTNSIAPVPTLENVTAAQKHAEVEAILSALNRTKWNRKQAAAILRVDYKALLYKLKKLGIDRKETLAVPAPEVSQDPVIVN
ncbi:MAG TPA: sigma-54 dependent transcriptional regulator [Bryobacteraceae bacterium]|nr:sigma-54 dependent transcriptional regulator [Bryobacteraceae bacterium]